MPLHDAHQALADAGQALDGELQIDGRIHRYHSDKDKRGKRDSWYIAFDRPLTVVFGHWSEGGKTVWRDDGERELDKEQRKRVAAEQRKRQARRDRQRRHWQRRLAGIWSKLPKAGADHPYLQRKRVLPYGIRQWANRLVVPMKDGGGKVAGLQLIWPNGFKRYIKGSKGSSTYHGIGKPNGTIYIAEGYATAASIHEVTGQACVVAFSAGNLPKAARMMADKFPDKELVICADNDQWTEGNPGVAAAHKAAKELDGAGVRVPQFVDPQEGATDYNDLLIAEGEDAVHKSLMPQSDTPPPEPDIELIDDGLTAPFRCLGYSDGTYYYFPDHSQQITAITAAGHGSRSNLLQLAPLEWWETAFAGGKGKADWDMATNALFRWCEHAGPFDPRIVRGRGAWYDDGRAILHLGTHLLADGEPVKLHKLGTQYIYERRPAVEALEVSEPLDAQWARELLDICGALNWETPASAILLAGWCVLAPICGAMAWRPHIWLTGARGTGKSWAVDNIIRPAVGDSALMVQSNSTEAGIRQMLGHDALPVMFDEAEGEARGDRSRMQHVITLARQASSEGAAQIAKGTTGGKALSFRVRSMFLLSSVNVGLQMAADKSRFSVLDLKHPPPGQTGRQQFESLMQLVDNTLTPAWCSRLRTRTYHMIPTIRHNAGILAKAAAETLGNQRAGDQYGTLLAGAWSLSSDDRITLDRAREWIASHKWEHAEDTIEEDDSDEMRLLAEIAHAQIRLDASSGAPKTRSVVELIGHLSGRAPDYSIDDSVAEDTLARHGIRFSDKSQRIAVSNTHPEIRRMLIDSPWSGNWARVLARLDGAETAGTMKFCGLTARAVLLPVSVLFDEPG